MSSEDFAHVSNRLLRHTLESEPRHVKQSDLEAAVRWTAEAIGMDMIDPGVPRHFIEARTEFARRANEAAKRGQKTNALTNLRKVWSI